MDLTLPPSEIFVPGVEPDKLQTVTLLDEMIAQIEANETAIDSFSLGIVLAVTNIAALLALSSAANNASQLVYVRGYSAVGDGGEGWFRWNPTSTATHDGFIVYRPNDKTSGQAGRWYRDYGPILLAEWGGVVDDAAFVNPNWTGTDTTTAIRNAITAATAHQISTIGFLGRNTGKYRCDSKIVNGTTLTQGLQFVGLRPRGGNDSNVSSGAGIVFVYTGEGGLWDIRHAVGTSEIGKWTWKDMMITCSDADGFAFDFNFLTQAGVDYAPTDDVTTPNYVKNVLIDNVSFWGHAGGYAIRAKKSFNIVTTATCLFRDWKWAIYTKGCDNCEIGGTFTINEQHIHVESGGNFGNNMVLRPAFLGALENLGGDRYFIFDEGKYTLYHGCLQESDSGGDAHLYLNGAGFVAIAPVFGANIPAFAIGPNMEDNRIYGPVCRASGVMRYGAASGTDYADLIDAPANLEWGYQTRAILTVYDANLFFCDAIGQHPRIKFISGDQATLSRPEKLPQIFANGPQPRQVELFHALNWPFFFAGTVYAGVGFSGFSEDSASFNGWGVDFAAVANSGAFSENWIVGKNINNGDWVRVVVSAKTLVALGAGGWRFFVSRNSSVHSNVGTLTAGTAFVNTVFTYQLAGYSDGDEFGIGINRNAADQILRVEAISFAVVRPNIANLSAITGGQSPTEAEHNLVITQLTAILDELGWANRIAR